MAYNPTSITSLAQGYVPFANAKPAKQLWVSTTGSDSNSGSSSAPFKTISAAMAKADAGTAVMVKAGSYVDSVRMKSGAADKPIWLVSADGEGAAKITAKSAGAPVIFGFGNDNMVIKGFQIVGGMDGIKFTQGGSHLANPADNIVLQDNTISGQTVDGVKIAQARNVVVVANTIRDVKGADEAIDIFYTRKGIVANNDIDRIQGQGGIVVKAGSENVKILDNDIDHVQRGIVVGGWAGGDGSSWPAKMGWQAKNLHVEGNYVHNTTKFALLTQGAIDSTITKNAFLPSNTYYTVAATGADNNGWQSSNIKFTYNIVQRDKWLTDPGRDVSVNIGNVKTGAFDRADVGPAALDSSGATAPAQGSAPPSSVSTVTSPIWKDSGAVQAKINGTASGDTLTGTAKNDYIDGGGSHDTMSGLAGDDIYIVGSLYDKVVERAGDGIDTVRAWVDRYTLPANVENLVVARSGGAVITDNALNNKFTASAGADTFTNNGGHDVVIGFKVGVDHIDLSTGATVARTAANDIVIQHGTASVTLVGVDYHSDLGSIIV